MVKNKVICQVVGHETQGSVTLSGLCNPLPPGLFDGTLLPLHDTGGWKPGEALHRSVGSLQLPREREEARTTQNLVSGRGLFNQMQQATPTHSRVLAALRRHSLVRAMEYPSTNRGSSTMKTVLRVMLHTFILR